MTDRELMQQALQELEKLCQTFSYPPNSLYDIINALRARLAQPEQEPKAFYVYKPTLPRGSLGNVADGDLPWVYDQDPSSGYSAKMLVYPASSA